MQFACLPLTEPVRSNGTQEDLVPGRRVLFCNGEVDGLGVEELLIENPAIWENCALSVPGLLWVMGEAYDLEDGELTASYDCHDEERPSEVSEECDGPVD